MDESSAVLRSVYDRSEHSEVDESTHLLLVPPADVALIKRAVHKTCTCYGVNNVLKVIYVRCISSLCGFPTLVCACCRLSDMGCLIMIFMDFIKKHVKDFQFQIVFTFYANNLSISFLDKISINVRSSDGTVSPVTDTNATEFKSSEDPDHSLTCCPGVSPIEFIQQCTPALLAALLLDYYVS